MRVVNDAKVADLLDGKPEGVHVSELAKSTGLDEDKLSRILRLLSTTHVFQEGEPDFGDSFTPEKGMPREIRTGNSSFSNLFPIQLSNFIFDLYSEARCIC